MARRLRQAATSDWHHVMNRGARWLPIFGDDSDRTLFLSLLRDVRRRSTVEIHAYALMRNHFHLLLHADQPSMSDALKYVLGTYTQRFNHKYGLDGPLYRSRFRSVPIETERHLLAEVRYIHRNPVQGRAAPTLSDYRWTSHLAYAGLPTAPAWLITTAIATRFSSVDD